MRHTAVTKELGEISWPKFTHVSTGHKQRVERFPDSRAVVAQGGIGTARFRVVEAAFDFGKVFAMILYLLAQGFRDLLLKLEMD